jgi:putative tryptophan/tyrosine transport system substrate-binding protein
MAADHYGLHMSRRHFMQGGGMAGLGLLAGCGRWPGQAPGPPKVPLMGVLGPGGGPTAAALTALHEGLRELGYIEGQNLAVEWRQGTDPAPLDLDAHAAELVGLRVDVLLAFTTLGALAAKRATSSIPIVFTAVSDPVGSGLAASLGRPGGNATGISDFGSALSGKRLQLLRDAVPGMTRAGVVSAAGNPSYALQWRELEAAAPALGVQLVSLELRAQDELDDALVAAVREGVHALVVLGGPEPTGRVAALATGFRIPTLVEQGTVARAHGLMAYGPNRPDLYRRAAYYVDRILKGAQPADLPIEQPREFEFVINLKTAQALGLTIPPHVLLQATEVIQ